MKTVLIWHLTSFQMFFFLQKEFWQKEEGCCYPLPYCRFYLSKFRYPPFLLIIISSLSTGNKSTLQYTAVFSSTTISGSRSTAFLPTNVAKLCWEKQSIVWWWAAVISWRSREISREISRHRDIPEISRHSSGGGENLQLPSCNLLTRSHSSEPEPARETL